MKTHVFSLVSLDVCIHCNVCYLGHLGLLSKLWEIVILAQNIVTNYKMIWLLKKDDLMLLNQFKSRLKYEYSTCECNDPF